MLLHLFFLRPYSLVMCALRLMPPATRSTLIRSAVSLRIRLVLALKEFRTCLLTDSLSPTLPNSPSNSPHRTPGTAFLGRNPVEFHN
eukprot:COSAG02_NODE_33671_length_496_cov_1.314861_1_plen_86_part_10